MIVAHNLVAMNANRMLGINSKSTAKSTEKVSSGYKINRAADDAAGLAISEKMRRQIRGLNQGANNTTDGISWVKIGDGAMNEVSDMVNRMTELSVKAANGTLSDSDREAIDSEMRQLKKEIDRVSATTVFNEIPIFDNTNYQASLTFQGIPWGGLELYNASYDDVTGEFSFGGVIMLGERVSWDEISPDMVSLDGNGKQVFKPGTYTYSKEGMDLIVTWEEGAKAPGLTMELSVLADSNGIALAGQSFGWEKLVDENGNAAGKDNVHSGNWTLDGGNFKAIINIPYETDSLREFVNAINTCTSEKITYHVQQDYVNNKEEKAVVANLVQGVRVSKELADELEKTQISVQVEADDTGIGLQGVDGSKKTWAEMGINWKNGINSSNGGLYHYEYYSSNNSDTPYLSFDFNISEIASMDSVIDGLNGMELEVGDITSSYGLGIKAEGSSNIVKFDSSQNNIKVNFEQEIALGRDFETQTITGVGAATPVDVDATAKTAKVEFAAKNGTNDSVTYTGDITTAEAKMTSDVVSYLDYITMWATQAALAGTDLSHFKIPTLTDLVGKDNITTSGHFTEKVKVNDNMSKTPGSGSAPLQSGQTYAGARIDFSNITTANLDDLLLKGFNSTCMTCNNHYSVVFKSGLGSDYNFSQDQSNNYTLEVSIKALKDRMEAVPPMTVAEALVDIFSQKGINGTNGFDFHYTQYAAGPNGSPRNVLYICDDRTSQIGSMSATFDTKPYTPIEQGFCSVSLSSTNNGSMELKYDYSFKEAAEYIEVNMVEDNVGGEYIQNSDGTFSIDNTGSTPRYKVEVAYIDPSTKQRLPIQSKDAAAKSWVEKTLADMLTHTTVSLDATDYTYMHLSGEENDNVAIRAVYDKKVGRTDYVETGIRIQHSAEVDDYTEIPRFALNTMALGLSKAGTKTMEQALETLDYVAEAANYVASKRAQYGALQNRLEHTYNNLLNTAENTQAAESRIRDTDMASEMVWYSNYNILLQSGQAMLAQANKSNQGVLSLLS